MRKWRHPMPNPIDPIEGDYRKYEGFQKFINSDKGQIDDEKLDEHVEMLMNDEKFKWETIDPVNFTTLKLGDRIRYTTLNPKGEHLFRTGGWVIAIDGEEYKWITYLAHTKTPWSIQKNECKNLWVVRKQPKKPKKHIFKFKLPGNESTYNSYLPETNGIMQRVYSTNLKHENIRFENTFKFKTSNEGGLWEFI
jgi:hypothetical protein